MKTWQSLFFGILLGFFMSGIILLISSSSGHEILISPPPTAGPALVYIAGEVKNPGVYSFLPGSRVKDIIQVAGGLTQNADTIEINLASLVYDGDKINIPNIASQSDVKVGLSLTGKQIPLLDINIASQADLERLPGIGPSKALEIIKYRNENGRFSSIEEINKVPGVGQTLFSQIKDYLFISP